MKNSKRKYPDIVHACKRPYYPLSFQQERVWYLAQLAPESTLWNRISCKRLKGRIDVQSLSNAFEGLRDRHTILRAKVSLVNNSPVQSFPESTNNVFQYVDLSYLDESQRDSEAIDLLNKESWSPIYVNDDQLFKAMLIMLSETDYMLLMKLHHIISDATTLQIIWRDLKLNYNSYLDGNDTLPQLNVCYHDYVLWQRDMINSHLINDQEIYWLNQFEGEIPTLNLPTDFSHPSQLNFRGALERAVLPKELIKGLQSLSLRKRVLLFSTFLSAYCILLQKYCHQDDMIIGTVFSGRHYNSDIKNVVGFFVNTVAVRMNVEDDLVFEELLGQVHKKVTDAFDMQDYPFERLIQKINPDRNKSGNPLFRTAFNMVTTYKESVSFKGIQEESWIEPETNSSQVDLTLDIRNNPEDTEVRIEYNTDLYRKETIRRMIKHYCNLLHGIVIKPGAKVSELDLLDLKERKELLTEWNNTRIEYSRDRCIHELFEEQVERNPEGVAVVYEDEHLSYRELNNRANRLAHYLRSLGVGSEVLVGICVERSLEMVVGMLGIMKAGGVYVPIDPTYPKDRLSFMLKDAHVSVFLTLKRLLHVLPNHTMRVVCLDADWYTPTKWSDENIEKCSHPDNSAYIIYTSGSTGTPKGVTVNHRNVLALLYAFEHIAPSDGNLIGASVCPFGFDVSVWEFFSNLCFGGTLHILLPKTFADPGRFVDYLRTHHVTSAYIPPGLLSLVTDEFEKRIDCILLHRILVGVEPIKQEILQRFRNLSRKMHIINGYGPTEATICATFFDFQSAVEPERRVPIGKAISGYKVYLVNRHLQPVPIGVTGEILVGGDGVARGYLNHPELTAEKFVPNPFDDEAGERLYRTGDLARYLPDGNIEILGRIDHQVKIRGFRIEMEEIEAVLMRNQEVHEAMVTIWEDEPGNKRMVAYVVLNQGEAPIPNKLRSFLRRKLPDYMVPSDFVMLEAMPRAPNGKVDRRALPAPERRGLEERYVAPRTPIEETVAGIWAELLGVERVGIHDNFFELGGHSLLATQAILRIREAIEVDLPLSKMLEIPSVADLADYIGMTTRARKHMMNIEKTFADDREVGRI